MADTYVGGIAWSLYRQEDVFGPNGPPPTPAGFRPWSVQLGSRGAVEHPVGWLRNPGTLWQPVGFDTYEDERPRRASSKRLVRRVCVPYWAIVLLGLVLPAWRGPRLYRGWRAAKWAKSGRCVRCGYDLQGSPSPRFPECGHGPGGVT